MQDKDFDRLFSDKLSNLEVEPSREVWKGITAELDKSKRKPLGVYLSVAASLLVMLTAGIYFIGNKETLKPQQPIAVVKLKVQKPETAEIKAESTAPVQDNRPLIAVAPKLAIAKAKPVRMHRSMVKKAKETPAIKTDEPVNVEPVLSAKPGEQLAQLPAQKAPAIKFTVPDKTIPLIEKTEDTAQVSIANVAVGQQPAKTLAAAPVRKHKIRGIGDLLNAVVSKIDKRKDKLIEFSSKDEDEPNVTGLNLGFIKIKSQSR